MFKLLSYNYVGYGPMASRLESQMCQRTCRRHAFAVGSGFQALSLAVRALDLPPRSPVAMPVLTCPTVWSAIVGAGHDPVLVDIRESDLAINPAKIPSGVKAIIAPHPYGALAPVKELKKCGIPWIEDCATSPAAREGNCHAGCFGTAAIFSFNSTKYITGGMGGLLVTNEHKMACRVRDLLQETTSYLGWKNQRPQDFPGRLSDLNAVLVLDQLDRMNEFLLERLRIATQYDRILEGCSKWRCPEKKGHTYYRYILKTKQSSRRLAEKLNRFEVDARTSVNPWIHLEEKISGHWPVAEYLQTRLLSLPIYPGLRGAEKVAKLLLTEKPSL